MRVVAIIPARGGSKGVPGKNLRRVGGAPLVVRAIQAAAGSRSVDDVVVTTDADGIAETAARHGATVIRRPAELAGDTASSESALLHVLDTLRSERGEDPQVVAFLQCTSPFTRSDDVEAVLAPVLAGEADAAFTAQAFHGFVWRRDGSGRADGVNHDWRSRPRRQDRPAEYLETGAVYAFAVEGFRAAGHRFFGRVVPVEVPAERALEVDTEADLRLAEALATAEAPQPSRPRLRMPKLVALDFDGVFTDNRVLVDETGREAVWCHRGDGHGLAALARAVPVVVFSTEKNPVVAQRCAKLGLECYHSLGDDKAAALRRYVREHGIDLDDVLYVGNDVNDLACLRLAGTAVVVADAAAEVVAEAHVVLSRRGGHGALRELSDLLLASRTPEPEPPADETRT